MNLRANRKMWRAWNQAMKYGYFTSSYWRKYCWYSHYHQFRSDLWFDAQIAEVFDVSQ